MNYRNILKKISQFLESAIYKNQIEYRTNANIDQRSFADDERALNNIEKLSINY